MMRSKIILVLVFGALSAGMAELGTLWLTGTAEYSFDDSSQLLRTDKFVFKLKSNLLSRRDRRQLSKVGARISIEIPANAIAAVWPITLNQSLHSEERLLPVDSIARDGQNLVVSGTVLPSEFDNDAYMQINNVIVHLNTQGLPDSERGKLAKPSSHQSVFVPARSIDFAWYAGGQEASAPAYAPADRFELHRGWLNLAGTLLYSFQKGHSEIQSGATFFLIDDAYLPDSVLDNKLPGRHVAVRLPASSISMIWAVAEDEMTSMRRH